MVSIPSILKSPKRFLRVARAAAYPSSQPSGDHLAGLYSICVVPVAQGLGVGRKMTTSFLETARTRGCGAVYLHADADGNDGWNMLLQKMGWRLEKMFVTPEGRRMNEYWYVFEGDWNVAG